MLFLNKILCTVYLHALKELTNQQIENIISQVYYLTKKLELHSLVQNLFLEEIKEKIQKFSLLSKLYSGTLPFTPSKKEYIKVRSFSISPEG